MYNNKNMPNYSCLHKGWQFLWFFIQLGNFRLSEILNFRAFYSHNNAILKDQPWCQTCSNPTTPTGPSSSSWYLQVLWILWMNLVSYFETGGKHSNWRCCQPLAEFSVAICTLDHKDIDCLLHLIRQNSDYFLGKFMHMLRQIDSNLSTSRQSPASSSK